MVRCRVASFMMVHAIAVNCSATSASVNRRGGAASSASIRSVAGISVLGIADVFTHHQRRCVPGMASHWAPSSSSTDGSSVESTTANPPPSSISSVSLR